MKKGNFLMLMMGFIISFSGCKKEENPQTEPVTFVSLETFYSNHEEPVQTFTLNDDNDSPVTGSKGSKIYVEDGDIRILGQSPITYPLTLELREFNSKKDFILNGQPTWANARPIETAGQVEVNLFQGTNKLYMTEGESIVVEIPDNANMSSDMSVYYSVRQGGYFLWTDDATAYYNSLIQVDSVSNVEKVANYHRLTVPILGYSSPCKTFTNETTTVDFQADGDSTDFIDVYLVFKNYFSVAIKGSLTSNEQLPIGEVATVVAIGTDSEGNFYLHKEELTIETGLSVELKMEQITEAELLSSFDDL